MDVLKQYRMNSWNLQAVIQNRKVQWVFLFVVIVMLSIISIFYDKILFYTNSIIYANYWYMIENKCNLVLKSNANNLINLSRSFTSAFQYESGTTGKTSSSDTRLTLHSITN